jgi:putative endonuclease
VYIIYSSSLDKYYIGETADFDVTLMQHNTHFFKNSYTIKATDWAPFLVITCNNITHARKLESFIKKMKSRNFIESLKTDPDKLESIIKKTI